MSADGATVAAARALGGGRGALSDSSVVPLARGVARVAHLAALSGAVRGRGERKTHFSSTVRGSHACLTVCAWGALPRSPAYLERARRAAASAARCAAVDVLGSNCSRVRHSLDGEIAFVI